MSINRLYLPNLLSFSVSPHYTIYNGGSASLRVCIFFANRVHFDIFRVIHINEFFINIRAIGSRLIQSGINFTGFVADLKVKISYMRERYCSMAHFSEQSTSPSAFEVYIYVMIFSTDWLLDKGLLHDFPINYNRITVFS